MKKLLTVVFTMLMAGSLAFAQTGAGTTDNTKSTEAGKMSTGKKAGKTKAHKGGKKGKKKGSSTTPAAAPATK